MNQSKVRRDYDPWHDVPLPRNLEEADKEAQLETDDAEDHPEEDALQKDQNIDYVADFEALMAKVTMGSFWTLNVSFDNAEQVLERSTPRCSITPLLIDYGLEVQCSL